MGRKIFGFLVIIMVSSLPAFARDSPEGGSPFTGNVSVMLGNKQLESADWAPWDDHGEAAILFDLSRHTWPLSIAVDLRLTVSDTASLAFAITREANVGVRKVFRGGRVFRPYVGGGLSVVDAALIDDATDTKIASGSGLGVWAGVGVYVDLSEHIHIGLDFARSSADVSLLGVSVAAGGTHRGLSIGYHW